MLTWTLDLFGDTWTLLIVRGLLWHSKDTYQMLQQSAARMPTNIRADRLTKLQAAEFVQKEPYHLHNLSGGDPGRTGPFRPALVGRGSGAYCHRLQNHA